MTQRREGPMPRRVVRYRMSGDALGRFITFPLDVVVLPDGVPPHKLPMGATLRWERLSCRFSGDPSLGAHELRRLFMEFAEAMNWDAHLDP